MHGRRNLSILRALIAVILALVLIATICSLLGSASIDAASPGEAPTSPTGRIDFIGPGEGNGLSLASSKLFMNRSCGSEEVYTSPTYVIARSTSSPNTPIQLYRNNNTCIRTSGSAGHVLSINVAADSTYAYWLTRNGNIVRNRHNTTPLTNPEIIRRMVETNPVSSPPVYSIAVNATTIFWNEGRRIYSTPKSIGGAYTLLGSTTYGVRKLYVTNTSPQRLLYLDGSNLMSMNLTPPYSQNTRASNVSDYYVDDVWIYLGRNLGSTYELRSISVSSFLLRTVHYTSPTDPSLRVSHVAAGGGRLYWFENQGNFGGQIFMILTTSGPRSAQSDSLRNIVTMVADSNYLYWLNQSTPGDGIYRLTPGSAVVPVTGDMRITGISVTQGMQVGNDLIPLISRKPTVVRVFVASTPGNQGPWRNVRARLEVAYGYSNSLHYATMSQLPIESNARVLTETFNFALSGWETLETLATWRHITATLFSMSGRREDNRTNNTYSKHLLFWEHPEIALAVFQYSNLNRGSCPTDHADGYITPWNNIISHTVDARDVLPIYQMYIFPAGGMGTPPINDDDCLAYRRAVERMTGWMDRMYSTGGYYGLVMQPDSGHIGGHWETTPLGNIVINIQDVYLHHTLAHEVTHTFPGVYYDDSHTYDADSHYPRAAEPGENFRKNWMGDFIGLQTFGGTRLILGSLHPNIPSHDVWDIMSVTTNRWTSPYTYCKNMKYMASGRCCQDPVEGGCSSPDLPSQNPYKNLSSAVEPAGTQLLGIHNDPDSPEADAPYLYVSGWISPTNEVSFNPFEIVSSSKDISTLCSGLGYSINLLDSTGSTLQDCTFDVVPVHDDYLDNPTPTRLPGMFSVYLPWDNNTVTITLESKSSILTQRTVSAHAPLNVVQAFSPPEPVSGIHTLSWIASDEDGDPLVFSIWYSPDNGSTWLPINVSVNDQKLDIDFDQLPGSNGGEGLLRVLASDGVRTTESRTETPFTIKHKYPSISLTPMYDSDGNITLIQASATDPEDKIIIDPEKFSWSSNWDGQLGDGQIFNTAGLAPGEHVLTVGVTDSDGMQASASIMVNAPSNFESGGLMALPFVPDHLFFDASLPMTLTVPKYAVKEPVRFRASLPLDTSFDPPGAIGPSFIISAALSTGQPVIYFNNVPLSLTIAYTHDVIPVYNEGRAKIFTWDEDNLKWTGLDTVVDKINNRATATVLHLSRFALVVPDEPMLYLPIISR